MKVAIFDRDGVIIDTEALNIKSADVAFQKLGVNLTEEDKKIIVGRHPADYGIDFQKKYDFKIDDLIGLQKDYFYNHIQETPLFNKTIKFVKKLKHLGVPIALTTSASKISTNIVLKYAGLEDVFDLVVTSEDYNRRKPEPDAYLITAEKLKVKPENCAVFEDSYVGLVAAKRAGMKCVILPNVYTKDQDFSTADILVHPGEELTIDLIK